MALQRDKIFQIGFNKCRTHSLHRFFLDNNIRSIHWARGEVALEIHRNCRLGRRLLGRFESRFDAFIDMEDHRTQTFGSRYFKQLHAEHPSAFFILNTRPVDKWLESRFGHHNGEFAKECATILRMNARQLVEFWRAEWYHHHEITKEYFKDYSRFLVFDIETDDGIVLQDFLKPEYDVDPSAWGHHFATELVFPKAST